MHENDQPHEKTCEKQWLLADETQTEALACNLAQTLAHMQAEHGSAEAVSLHINLHGNLGAGKTTFTRHVLRALGITGRIKSPSYAIVEQYHTPAGMVTHHFDFYRFNDPQEWEDAGFREPFTEAGLKLVEWPDKAQPMLPVADIDLEIMTLVGLATVESTINNTMDTDNIDGEETQPEAARQFTATAHTPTGRKILDVWNYAPTSA